jgi:hypothetical protein
VVEAKLKTWGRSARGISYVERLVAGEEDRELILMLESTGRLSDREQGRTERSTGAGVGVAYVGAILQSLERPTLMFTCSWSAWLIYCS